MKASELNKDDIISITWGACISDSLVVIHGVEGDVAVGSDLDTGETMIIEKDSDHRSANGSPIGSWHKLSTEHALSALRELMA